MKGRPPKAPELRIADGTHRRDRHGDKDAFGKEQYLESVPACPSGKKPTFRKHWRRYCEALIAVGQLTTRDIPAIEELCEAHQECFEAESSIKSAGARYVETPFGISAHPAVGTILKVRKLIHGMQIALGFTAVGRSKVPPRNLSGGSAKSPVSGMQRKKKTS